MPDPTTTTETQPARNTKGPQPDERRSHVAEAPGAVAGITDETDADGPHFLDGLADEQGPIPAFGPARLDVQGRIVMTDEEWDARRNAGVRVLDALGAVADETDTDAVWDDVFRGLEGAC